LKRSVGGETVLAQIVEMTQRNGAGRQSIAISIADKVAGQFQPPRDPDRDYHPIHLVVRRT